MDDELSKLKVQKLIIEEDLIQNQQQIKVTMESNKEYQNQNIQLQEEIIEKQEKIEEKEIEITKLQQNSQKLTKEKSELKEKLTVKERIIEVLNEKLNNLQEEKGKLEDEISKLKEKNQDLIQVQEQIKTEQIKINKKQKGQLQEIIKQKENEIAELQQGSQNLTKEKTELEEELNKKISELEKNNKDTLERSQVEIQELENELVTLERKLNHEIKALTKNQEEKQQKINELDEEMEKERSRLEKVKKELNKADEILKSTQRELELRQNSDERELIISKVKELKNNINQLKIENEKSNQSLIHNQKQVSEMKNIDKHTKKQIKQKEDLEISKKELKDLKEELENIQKRLKVKEKELNEKLGKIGEFTVNINNISSKNIAKLEVLVKEKEGLIEKINKLKENKPVKEKKIKELEEKIQDEDWENKCKDLQKTIDKKIRRIEELEKELPRKILLIGRTGSGKSTLANVLTSTNEFKESNYSISQTKKIQRHQFDEKGIKYEVIDTIGLNDTKLSREDILYKLAELARELKDGLHQILLVNNGRFTEEEIQVYKILETVLFDENVKNYTTVVRTNFEKFDNEEECQNNRNFLIEEKSQIMTIIKDSDFFIHLDNPSNDINKREKSKIILLNHLNKQIGVYRPSKLEKLNERIMDYMKNGNQKLVIQEMDKQVSEFKDKLSDLGQIGSFISGLAAVAAIIVPLVSCNVM